MPHSSVEPGLAVALLLAAGIAFLSFKFRWVTLSGALAQWVLGSMLLGIGGWRFTIPIVVFFVSSSVLTSLGRQRKLKLDLMSAKTGNRDAAQVAANGGVAGVAVVMWGSTGTETWFWVHLGSLAAATADTWGTEIGVLSRRKPFDVVRLRSTEAGISGAVSISGTLAGLAGAFLIAMVGGFCGRAPFDLTRAGGVFLAGSLGAFADSLAGGILQVQYACPSCSLISEKSTHCGRPGNIMRGWRWCTNEAVNLLCTTIGGLIPLFLDFWWWNS
jgi:uncharacterized protein (TIGR00297 family)